MHLHALDLNLLVALDALLAEKNVTRAAERAGVTQPAMSHALARLRLLFGDPLLVRVSGGMKPTPRAAAMAPALNDALAAVARAIDQGTAFDPRQARRHFTIATDDYLERILLPPLLVRLWSEAPGIDIRVLPSSGRMAEALAEGKVDAVISIEGLLPALASVYTQSLFREKFLLAMRKDHPLTKGKVTLARFLAYPHLLVAPGGQPGSVVDKMLAKTGRKRRVAVSVPHFLAAPAILAASDTIALMGERLARTAADLTLLQPPLAVPGFSVALFWHERLHADRAHQWLRQVVSSVARTLS